MSVDTLTSSSMSLHCTFMPYNLVITVLSNTFVILTPVTLQFISMLSIISSMCVVFYVFRFTSSHILMKRDPVLFVYDFEVFFAPVFYRF